MTDANKAAIHRWFDQVWNHNNEAAIDELFAPNGHSYGFPEPESVVTGPAEFKAVHRKFASAFSNIHVHLDHLIGEGDSVAAVWTAAMIHTGDALGFAPTGKQVKLSGSTFLHLRDGVIQQGWNHMDFTRLAQQLQGPQA